MFLGCFVVLQDVLAELLGSAQNYPTPTAAKLLSRIQLLRWISVRVHESLTNTPRGRALCRQLICPVSLPDAAAESYSPVLQGGENN
jgi:hypothetical protein